MRSTTHFLFQKSFHLIRQAASGVINFQNSRTQTRISWLHTWFKHKFITLVAKISPRQISRKLNSFSQPITSPSYDATDVWAWRHPASKDPAHRSGFWSSETINYAAIWRFRTAESHGAPGEFPQISGPPAHCTSDLIFKGIAETG